MQLEKFVRQLNLIQEMRLFNRILTTFTKYIHTFHLPVDKQ